MWLLNSSIGRKFVMAVTGACLVLFVTFHCLMNSVAIIWPTVYNQICELLGANWYALVASAGLAFLFLVHVLYALCLTFQNRKARGNDRYAVTSKPKQVEWSSKNMLVLGIVILAFLVVHLIQFWYKMQYQEMMSNITGNTANWIQADGAPIAPAFGTLFLQQAFSNIWTPIVYIIGFVALWFHFNHGFWSMFHTVGWDANRWIGRLKAIGCIWATVVVLLFIAQAVVFTVRAHQNYYSTNVELQEQYAKYWDEKAHATTETFMASVPAEMQRQPQSIKEGQEQQKIAEEFFMTKGKDFLKDVEKFETIQEKQFPDINTGLLQGFNDMNSIKMQVARSVEMIEAQEQLKNMNQQ